MAGSVIFCICSKNVNICSFDKYFFSLLLLLVQFTFTQSNLIEFLTQFSGPVQEGAGQSSFANILQCCAAHWMNIFIQRKIFIQEKTLKGEKIIILDIAQSAVWGDTCLNMLGLFRQKNYLRTKLNKVGLMLTGPTTATPPFLLGRCSLIASCFALLRTLGASCTFVQGLHSLGEGKQCIGQTFLEGLFAKHSCPHSIAFNVNMERESEHG